MNSISYFIVMVDSPRMTAAARCISCMIAVGKLSVDNWSPPASDLCHSLVLKLGNTTHSQQDVNTFTGSCTLHNVMKWHTQVKEQNRLKRTSENKSFMILFSSSLASGPPLHELKCYLCIGSVYLLLWVFLCEIRLKDKRQQKINNLVQYILYC